MTITPGADLRTVHTARQDLLIALKTVLDIRVFYKESRLTQLDDYLMEALGYLARLGVTDRTRFRQALSAAQLCLDQVSAGLVNQSSLVGIQVAYAADHLRSVCEMAHLLPEGPDTNRQTPLPPPPPKRNIPFEGVLSDRDRKLIKLCAQGFTVTQISVRLKQSESMVRRNIGLVCEKLRVKNITQAVAMYVAAESEDYGEEEAHT